jgi:hypothetical protein
MSWLWLAALDGAVEPPGTPPLDRTVAEPRDGGGPVTLVVWDRGERPSPAAARVDARVVGDGPAILLSLTRAPAGLRLIFDDPAVLEARRAVLRGPSPGLVSTLVTGGRFLAGALFGGPEDAGPLPTDPFARVLPARRLRVPAGFLRPAPGPAGPSIERYGSSRPWPIDRFPGVQPPDSSSRFSRA